MIDLPPINQAIEYKIPIDHLNQTYLDLKLLQSSLEEDESLYGQVGIGSQSYQLISIKSTDLNELTEELDLYLKPYDLDEKQMSRSIVEERQLIASVVDLFGFLDKTLTKRGVRSSLEWLFNELANLYSKENKKAEQLAWSSLCYRLKEIPEQDQEELLASVRNFGYFYKSLQKFYLRGAKWFQLKKEQRQLAPVREETVLLLTAMQERIEELRMELKERFFSLYLNKNKKEEFIQTLTAVWMQEVNRVYSFINYFLVDQKEEAMALTSSYYPGIKNKKTLIFSCNFGTGHKIAAEAVQKILEKGQMQAVIYDLSRGALLGRDRMRKLFELLKVKYDDHTMNSTDLFNEILTKQLFFLINIENTINEWIKAIFDLSGTKGVTSGIGVDNNSWEKDQLRDLFFIEQPDQIVTTYHMDLNPIFEVAQEFNLPVTHIPTDFNMKFSEVFEDKTPSYRHFKSTVPNDGIEKTLATSSPLLRSQLVEGIGIPLREEFYTSYSAIQRALLRKKHNISSKEKVLYLSAGGNGQTLPHPELLANSKSWKQPLRILVIAGKNVSYVEKLRTQLQPIDDDGLLLKGKNKNVTVEIISNPDATKKGTQEEFFVSAQKISELLAICDVAIAKAGGLSVAELLFNGIPILFDHRKTPFSWERFNIRVAEEEKMGLCNYHLSSLEGDLKSLLEYKRQKKEFFYFPLAQEKFLTHINNQTCDALRDEKTAKSRSAFIRELHLFFCSESKEELGSAAKKAEEELRVQSEEFLDSDWKLEETFGHIKVITADTESERFERFKKEAAKVSLTEEQFSIEPAVNGNLLSPSLWMRAHHWGSDEAEKNKQGRMGCFMAHYNAIKASFDDWSKAQERLCSLLHAPVHDADAIEEAFAEVRRYSRLLIIEDNCGFGRAGRDEARSTEGEGVRLRRALTKLPDNWDMFYFVTMADDWGPSKQISDDLVKLNYGVLTKCYALQAPFYKTLLDHFESYIYSDQPIPPVDHVMAELHAYTNCYAPKGEGLCYRFSSSSTVKVSDKDSFDWQTAVWSFTP